MTYTKTLADELVRLIAEATPGDLSTAERHTDSDVVECPACNGDGELDAADYCNFDGVALGVQFYGIGTHFGAHERLWRFFMENRDAILTALRATSEPTEAGADELVNEWHDCGNLGWCGDSTGKCTRHNPEEYRQALRTLSRPSQSGVKVAGDYAEQINEIANDIGKRWDGGEIQIRETIFEAIRRGSALGRAIQSLEVPQSSESPEAVELLREARRRGLHFHAQRDLRDRIDTFLSTQTPDQSGEA